MSFAGAVTAAYLGANCDQISVGLTPINDLGKNLYLDRFQGGLYPNGSNDVPTDHAIEGLVRVEAVQPLDGEGEAEPNGKYVLLSIGMSNTSQEFCCGSWTFMGQAANHPDTDQTSLVIVNGAANGQSADTWDSPDEENYDRIRDERLAPLGLTEAQVQAVWVKVANPGPKASLPNNEADAYRLVVQMGDIARALTVRYPNLQVAFFSSRIYAGYSSTNLNPEPYAYESGFAVKWLVRAQIDQMAGGQVDPRTGDLDYNTVAPWIAWGPYPWADGLIARSDGLIWECDDFASDGTHPSMSGEQKVGTMLLQFMLFSPYAAPWFRADGGQIPGIPPDGFNAFRGFFDSGALADLLESDDNDLCYEPGIVLNPTEAPITLDFLGTLPNDSPASLDVTIESSANTVGLELAISFWNYNTDSWDVVGTDTQSLNDDTVRTFAGNPVDHVEPGTGEVRTRYEVRVVSFIFVFPWLDCIDQIFWTTTN